MPVCTVVVVVCAVLFHQNKCYAKARTSYALTGGDLCQGHSVDNGEEGAECPAAAGGGAAALWEAAKCVGDGAGVLYVYGIGGGGGEGRVGGVKCCCWEVGRFLVFGF